MSQPTIAKPFVIVLDDDEAIVQLLLDILSETSFPLKGFTEHQDALDFIADRDNDVCLVFSDYNLNSCTGLDVRRQMIELGLRCPFILISGVVSVEVLTDTIDLKVSKLIRKPFEPDDILAVWEKEGLPYAESLEEKNFFTRTFIDEATDLLEDLTPAILELEENADSPEIINNIFRMVHTIKGGSGVLEISEFTRFCHIYEDLLASIQRGEISSSTPKLISALLAGCDQLQIYIEKIKAKELPQIDIPHWTEQFNFKSGEDKKDQTKANTQNTKKDKEDTLKVPTQILDEFMELSGEITVIRNSINKLVTTLFREFKNNPEFNTLAEMVEEMNKINSSMQSKITELRKIPIKNIFRMYPRTIRDASAQLNKKIRLELPDDNLAIDTKLATLLSNSLIHVIRNACDHGIEMPEHREQYGKPSEGKITLNAKETGETIVVTVQDDGKGIDPEALKRSSVKKGLISEQEAQTMSNHQAYQLIFESGFSTAETITELSGRGVGMDMVKASIQSCRGKIEIESEIGKGTTFTFILPIPKSVLIINSLLVQVADQHFSIPQDDIDRLIQCEGERLKQIKELEGLHVFHLDDKIIEIVPLGYLLGFTNKRTISLKNATSIDLVIIRSDQGQFALQVDKILNAEEVVVKNLMANLHLGLYNGATFMSDGRVGLVLDMEQLARKAHIHNDSYQSSQRQYNNDLLNDQSQYLVTKITEQENFCINLNLVNRLDVLDPKQLTFVKNEAYIVYMDDITPVIDTFQRTASHNQTLENFNQRILEQETWMTVIIQKGDNRAALIIKEIGDLIATYDTPNQSLNTKKFIDGSIVLGGKLFSILNPFKLCPDVFGEFNAADFAEAADPADIPAETAASQTLVTQAITTEAADTEPVEGLHLF